MLQQTELKKIFETWSGKLIGVLSSIKKEDMRNKSLSTPQKFIVRRCANSLKLDVRFCQKLNIHFMYDAYSAAKLYSWA